MTTAPLADPQARAWQVLETVPDPEIPVLSVVDLGIVRYVHARAADTTVGLAPTYTGCPAVEVIEATVSQALQRELGKPVIIDRVLSPPWTTDWITEAGRKKLADYGIAPPAAAATSKRQLFGTNLAVACPRCDSRATTRVSEFGSTPCKAAYKCDDCLEPFDYFKCI